MSNLLKETLELFKDLDITEEEVLWVGTLRSHMTWEHFKLIADVQYDSGFGSQEIACDLLIVGTDWWLERTEYDGAEAWDFKTYPTKPEKERHPQTVITDGYPLDDYES